MKKLIYIIICATLIISCKDDPASPKEFVEITVRYYQPPKVNNIEYEVFSEVATINWEGGQAVVHNSPQYNKVSVPNKTTITAKFTSVHSSYNGPTSNYSFTKTLYVDGPKTWNF